MALHRLALPAVWVCTLLLAACASPAATVPTVVPTAAAPAATHASPAATARSAATQAAAPNEAALESTATAPAAPPPATVIGDVVLRLGAGTAPDQVGISGDAGALNGPRAFRIGADGSIRLLDPARKRVLFFKPDGTLQRTLPIDEATSTIDFIVSNTGDLYVLATIASGEPKVLHYAPSGKLAEQIPVGQGIGINANGIMLTAEDSLMLVQNNQLSWTIRHHDTLTPPAVQALTQQHAVPTPRSPALFASGVAMNGTQPLTVIGLTGSVFGDMLTDVTTIQAQVPDDMRFFNVDRAMNLYFASDPAADQIDVTRVAADGAALGGARIDQRGCDSSLRSWRSFYIDQDGSAWGMCVTPTELTIARYTLRDAQGQPLPPAAQQPADVAWKPGANFSAA